MKKPRYLNSILGTIRKMSKEGRVQFTLKALRELASMDLGLDELDVCEILCELKESDFKERKTSSITGEYLYIFSSKMAGMEVYLKVILRNNCVVISFHEDFLNER